MARRIMLLVSSMGSGGAEWVAATLTNAWAERAVGVRERFSMERIAGMWEVLFEELSQ